jgi:bacterioferritin-associated ferredoxin
MNLDDDVCCCYHVSMGKLINFTRRTRPERASQMTQCLGAGTGCGWCIPFLVRIAKDPDAFALDDMTPEQYAEERRAYRASGRPKHTLDTEGTEQS